MALVGGGRSVRKRGRETGTDYGRGKRGREEEGERRGGSGSSRRSSGSSSSRRRRRRRRRRSSSGSGSSGGGGRDGGGGGSRGAQTRVDGLVGHGYGGAGPRVVVIVVVAAAAAAGGGGGGGGYCGGGGGGVGERGPKLAGSEPAIQFRSVYLSRYLLMLEYSP